jgi:hypothetical protein
MNGKSDYQKRVLTQQFCHEWMSVEGREKHEHVYSSDSKKKRKEFKEERKTSQVSESF